jgi:hypothetical protein
MIFVIRISIISTRQEILWRISKTRVSRLKLTNLVADFNKDQWSSVLVVVRRYPKYSRPSLPLLLIPLSPCVVRDRGRQEYIRLRALSLPCLWLGSGASIAIGGGGSGNLFPSHLCPPLPQTLIPLLRVDWSTLFVYFIGSTTSLRWN